MDAGKDATDPLLHMDMEIGVERVSAYPVYAFIGYSTVFAPTIWRI